MDRGPPLKRGTVAALVLDPTIGHEQHGYRPCVVVSDPSVNADQRFPLLAVIPLTGTAGEGALYPMIAPGENGLRKTSYALIDQLRCVDKRRIRRVFGQVGRDEMGAIDEGLLVFLGLCPSA